MTGGAGELDLVEACARGKPVFGRELEVPLTRPLGQAAKSELATAALATVPWSFRTAAL